MQPGDRLKVGKATRTKSKNFVDRESGEEKSIAIVCFENEGFRYELALSAGLGGALASAGILENDAGEWKVIDAKTPIEIVRHDDKKNTKGQPLSIYDVFAL